MPSHGILEIGKNIFSFQKQFFYSADVKPPISTRSTEHTLSMCILRSVWFQATFKSVLMKNLIPLSNQQLLFKSRSRRFDSFLRICNGDFFEVFTTIGFAYPESKLKKIDLPRERMCFWAVLAEKVAAAAS